MHKNPDISAEYASQRAKALQESRVLVGYRDGKVYVGSTKKMAHIQDRGILSSFRDSNGEGCKGR